MDRVLDRLFVGATSDLSGATPLRALGFSAVLDLRDGLRDPPGPPGVEVLRIQNRDGDPWRPEDVERALAFIHEHVRIGRVLVACAAGMSRSASIAVAYLVRCGWDPPSAFECVRAARPEVAPVEAMIRVALGVAQPGARTEVLGAESVRAVTGGVK